MSTAEWEMLCDGCGRCCLFSLVAKEEGIICYTNVACRHLDAESCACRVYEKRHALVPNCREVTLENVDKLTSLPGTCAYRLLSDGKSLKWWHPLVCGDPWMIHKAGISVRHKVISEKGLQPEQFTDYVIAFDFAQDRDPDAYPALPSLKKPVEGALSAPDFI